MLSPRSLTLAAALAGALIPSTAPAQWTNGQSAVNVVGQTGFGLSGAATTAAGLNAPQGVCIDAANGKMYVADTSNNRVLRYAYPIGANGPSAEAVIGQPSFTAGAVNNGGISASSMRFPNGVAVGTSGTLYVVDGNSRVLVFPSAHLAAATGTAASRVLGQANFSSNGPATTAAGMSGPSGCAFEAPDRLWVADRGNNRVLRFDGVSAKANGAAADGVLGQPNFTSGFSGTASQSNLGAPSGVAVHQGTLFVAEFFNDRVIRHAAAAAKANGANADGVLGQPNFNAASSGTSATSMEDPVGLAIDVSGRLYVAEQGNRRVTIFDSAASKANSAAADRVLGQPGGFGNAGTGNNADQMNGTTGVAVDGVNNRLIVGDQSNNRVTVFQASAPLPVAVSAVSVE